MTKKGFDRERHKQVLLKLIVDIYKEFGGRLGFKGGTCAYLFYDLPRISLDLDFDMLDRFDDKDIDALKALFSKKTEIKDFRDKKFTLFFLLDYEKNTPNIKVELNKRVWKNNAYKNILFLGIQMRIADEATLLTNKIVALTDRKIPVARDLFDVCYFLKLGYSLNEELIKERTGKNAEEYLGSLTRFIVKNFSEKNILYGLGEVLEEKQKKWVRKELIKETAEEIKKRL
jgi:predicted nucleotidyltransferase component of viral defense system